jgi:malate dehydrogenase (oxaloacetate-decarboxylating)
MVAGSRHSQVATTDDSPLAVHHSASFSATLRVHLDNRPGSFARLAEAIAEAGGLLGAIDLVRIEHGKKVRDVTVLAGNDAHVARIVDAVRAIDGVEVEHVSDRTFLLHLGGKLEVLPKLPLKTRDELSMAYTPGVARICAAIAEDPAKVRNLTVKQHSIAVVTDGSAVLGLGDIGPEAALPVMEGKALLFKEFGGIDAWPLCLATHDVDEIVRTVTAIAPVFGGINLEDISAPRCFEIEARLRAALDIPVFHDDQHGTAIVVLAALLNALRVVGKRLEDARVVMTGAGAAGSATARMLRAAGRATSSCAIWTARCIQAGRISIRSRRRLPRRRIGPVHAALPTRRSPAPTSTSACRARAPFRRTRSARWPTRRSSLRWRTRRPRSRPRRSKETSP